ncbi:S-layer homology domain-containing protein [Paenibacillus sp. UNCCL117]|uniref:S-layer homology domain-containing protein n=1 Tax=unclassified Paenibacillus TaxID=185978 RepID=UPI000889C2D3|nr:MULTISPECIES: S-layer homology domain-containing protein [unclassified Paenibacillus]SDD59400.1 S-layer homology domain-containing protein [Paenibacillus sp. cl123]SFW50826.1 S-layer homology domain-containing protein [Paenibacillus sp. UNCCL117]
MKLLKRTLVSVLALLLALGSLTQATSALAAVITNPKTTVLENKYIKITVDNATGRFGIRTADGQPVRKKDDKVNLMFRGDDPDTSFTSFRIDGTDYIFGNPYKFGADFFSEITTPKIVENSDGTKQIETVWTIKGVAIKQILMLYPDPDNKLNAGNVNVRYEVFNNSGAKVELGTRILLDTQVGSNDGPEFQIGNIYRTPLMVERKLVHDPENDPSIGEADRNYYKLPAYWVMRDKFDLANPLNTNVVAYGLNNFAEANINLVDEMIVGHWNGLANTKWDYTPNPNLDFTRDTNDYGTADSAVAFYWKPKALEDKKGQSFETVYGLGEIIEPDKVFSIRFIDPPQQLATTTDNNAYDKEGLFNITVEIENLAMFDMKHSNMTATMELESGLSFVRRDEKSGDIVRDAMGNPVIETYRSKEIVLRKPGKADEEPPPYEPGDTETFTYTVQAKGKAWPTTRQYMLTVRSPETVAKLEGIEDEGLKAQYLSVKQNFILLPAVGQATPTYVYGLAPKETYSTDVKYLTVNITNLEAYNTGNAQLEPNFDLYLKQKGTDKRYKVSVKDSVVLQPSDDGFSGDMRISYRGGELVNSKGQVIQSGLGPELPLGEYQVEIDFKGDTGGDEEIAAMYDITTKQTFKVTDNNAARVREAGLLAVYKQYVDLSSVTSSVDGRYLAELNAAYPGEPFKTGALLKDAVDAYKRIKEKVAIASKMADSKFDTVQYLEPESLKKVAAYNYKLFDSEKEMNEFFAKKDANDNFVREKLVDIRGMIKEVGEENKKQVIVDTKTEPALINEAVAYRGKDMVFVRGKLDIFGISKSESGYDTLPFLDSLFVKGEGSLSVANSGFVFYAGEWTLDFFNGFDKKLAPNLIVKPEDNIEVFPDNHENPEDTSLNGTLSWATGALGDRLNPLRQLMLTHVYFNKHSLFAAPGFMVGGFGFTFNDYILRPGGISFGGKVSMKIVDGEIRNVVFNDKGFVGVDARLRFDLGKDLGLFEEKKKEKKEGESSASGAITVVHYVQQVEDVSNKYGIRFKADVKGKFEVQAELAFKQVKDGRVLPDVVAFGTTLGDPGILITGATYLSAVRGAVRELADTIAGGTSKDPFPLVIQAGVDMRFGVPPVYLFGSVDMTVKRTGLAILGKLDFSADPKGANKINMITKALLEAQWVTPWFVRVETEVDIGGWGVVVGKAGIFVGQNLEKKRIDFEGYIGARLQIPESVPVVGGMPLSSVFLGLNNDKVWGSIGILFISLGITYYWGGGVEFGTSQEDVPEGFAHLLIEDPEKGPQLLVIGAGMSTVATSWLDAEKGSHEIVYRDIAEGMKLMDNSAMEAGIGGIYVKDAGRIHEIPMGAVSGNGIIEMEYEETEVPSFTLKDKNGTLYPVVFDNTNTNPAANAFTQYIPAAQSATKADVRKAFIILPQAKAKEGGTWTLTAMKPVATRLLNVPVVADLNSVDVVNHATDPNQFTATWQVDNAKAGDTVDLYLTKEPVTNDKATVDGKEVLDPGEPGVLIAKDLAVDHGGSVNGTLTTGKLDVDVSQVELMGNKEDLRGLLQQGDYYLRAALKSSASFKTKTSANTFRITDPQAPGEVTDVKIEPAGNGFFQVSFKPAAKKAGQESVEHSYSISALQQQNGKLTPYTSFPEQLFTEEELQPYWNAESGRYEGILVGGWTEFSNSAEVNQDDLSGPKANPDEKKTYLGLEVGQHYVLGVSAATKPNKDNDNYRFADRVDSGNTLLPIPVEPKLGLTAGNYPDYLEVLTNQTKQTIQLFADQPDIEVEAIYNEQSLGKVELANSGLTSEGAITLDKFETDGTYGIELRAKNKRTKDQKVTFMYLNVDTSAPILYLDEPVTGQRTKNGAIAVSGTTSKDAQLTVYVDQVAEGAGTQITVQENGKFAGSVPVAVDSPEAQLIFVARDGAGNENQAIVAVTHDGFKVPAAIVLRKIDTLKPGEIVTVEPFLRVQQGKNDKKKAIFGEVPMTPEQTQRVSYAVTNGEAVDIQEIQVKDTATGKDKKVLQITAGPDTGASLITATYDIAASGESAPADDAADASVKLDTIFAASVKVPAPTVLERYTASTEKLNSIANVTKLNIGDTGEQPGYQVVYKVFAGGAGAAVPAFKSDLSGWSFVPQNGIVSAKAGDSIVVAKRTSSKKEAVGSSDVIGANVWVPTGGGGGGGGPMGPPAKDSVTVNNQTVAAERKNDTLTVKISAKDGADVNKGDITVKSEDLTLKEYTFRFDKEVTRQAADKRRNIQLELPQAKLTIKPDMLNGMQQDLEIKVRPNGAPAIRAMNQLAADMKGTLLAGGQGIEIITNLPEASRNSYLQAKVPVPASIKAEDISAVILRGADGAWTTVPWKSAAENGEAFVTVQLTGDGSLVFLHTEASFSDVADDFWGKPGIEAAAAKLFMQGKGDEQFDPDSKITRAEYPTVLLRVAGLMNKTASSEFTDVAGDAWYNRSVSIAATLGIVNGLEDGSYAPQATLTRAEAMTMVGRVMDALGLNSQLSDEETEQLLSGFEDRQDIPDWARKQAALSIKYGIIQGEGSRVNPLGALTRAQSAAIAVRLDEWITSK